MYYIQNTDRGFLGNAIFFWGLGGRGYTADLNKAQKYTEEDARVICLGNPEKNKAWPVEYLENNEGKQTIIDSQYIDSEFIKTFKK